VSLIIKAGRAASQGGIGAGRRVGAGDPGVFDFLKRAARTAIGFATGGPVGAISAFTGVSRGRPDVPAGPVMTRPGVTRFREPSATTRAVQGALPFGKTGIETVQIACPKGYRPNKSSYFLTDGTFVPERSKCVKFRRRNPMNAKALSRAIARIDGGKRLQNTLSEITTAKYTAGGKHKAHH